MFQALLTDILADALKVFSLGFPSAAALEMARWDDSVSIPHCLCLLLHRLEKLSVTSAAHLAAIVDHVTQFWPIRRSRRLLGKFLFSADSAAPYIEFG